MTPKDYNQFLKTLGRLSPHKEWPLALQALWFDAKGNWSASHDIAQDMHNDLGSWIHAYLHRKEGDEFNAGYWYRRANKQFPTMTTAEELKHMVEYVIAEDCD